MKDLADLKEYEVIYGEKYDYTEISNTIPRYVDFRNCSFVCTQFGGNFELFTYSKICFYKCDFTFADLTNTVFERCEFMDCTFTDAKLEGTILRSSDMTRCTFENADLRNFNIDVYSDVGGLITFKYGSKHPLVYHPTQPNVYIGCQLYPVDQWLGHIGSHVAKDYGYEKETYLIYRAVLMQIEEMQNGS